MISSYKTERNQMSLLFSKNGKRIQETIDTILYWVKFLARLSSSMFERIWKSMLWPSLLIITSLADSALHRYVSHTKWVNYWIRRPYSESLRPWSLPIWTLQHAVHDTTPEYRSLFIVGHLSFSPYYIIAARAVLANSFFLQAIQCTLYYI